MSMFVDRSVEMLAIGGRFLLWALRGRTVSIQRGDCSHMRSIAVLHERNIGLSRLGNHFVALGRDHYIAGIALRPIVHRGRGGRGCEGK